MDLVQTGEAVETEKDDLLEKVEAVHHLFYMMSFPVLTVRLDMQFMEFAKGVCNKATDRGHWADYIDPCSGLPVCLRSTKLAAWTWLLCSCNLPACCSSKHLLIAPPALR